MGLALRGPTGSLDAAESAFRSSLVHDPTDPFTHLYLSCVFYIRREYRESLAASRSAHDLAPTMDVALIGMADAFAGLREYQRADECYREAVRVDGGSKVARDNLKRWLKFWLPEQERRRAVREGDACAESASDMAEEGGFERIRRRASRGAKRR
jgi:tetratricopeptide (TPR) repeat protein